MLEPIALSTSGGCVLIGPIAMIPPARRGMQSPLVALGRIFPDPDAVAQLRRAWSRLDLGGGHHHPPTPEDMRATLERAIALHRIALLWIPAVSHHAIHVPIPPKRPAPPAPPRANAPPGMPVKPPPVPVGTMAIPAKVERALVQSFDYIARDSREGFKAFVEAIDALRKDPVAMAKIVAFCALLAVPVVGEAAASAFLAYAYYLLGFHGTLAALHFGAACVRAATATTDAEIDAAAREFADAFEDLGEAVIAWLMTRIQPMSSVGARSAAAEKEAAVVARAETQAAKVVKPAESYQTQVLSKYQAAKDEAKVAGAAGTSLKAALATKADEAVFWSGKTAGIGGADVAGEIAKSVNGTTLEQLMAERGVELPVWDAGNPASVAAWENASQSFAEGAKGNVTAVIGDMLRPGNVWETKELPALLNNSAVTQITKIDPATGIKTIIYGK